MRGRGKDGVSREEGEGKTRGDKRKISEGRREGGDA